MVAPAAAVVVAVTEVTLTPATEEDAAAVDPIAAVEPWDADWVKQVVLTPVPTVMGPEACVAPVLSLISSVMRVLAANATFHVRLRRKSDRHSYYG